MLYYDPFDVVEEEDFLESERNESERVVQRYVEQWKVDPLVLQTIQLNLPLSNASLQSLVQTIIVQKNNKRLLRLSVSHWGLGDEGITVLIPILAQHVRHLQLTNCGITAIGFYQMLSAMASMGDNQDPWGLECLDLSRNNLLAQRPRSSHRCSSLLSTSNSGMQSMASPQEVLRKALTEILPQAFRHHRIQSFDLTATGLHTPLLMTWLWQGIVKMEASSNLLQFLNVSHNVDSLQTLLETLLPFLQKGHFPVAKLYLAKGASSSTCLEDCRKAFPILNDVLQMLQQQTRHSHLIHLGPMSMLPLDKEAPYDLHILYQNCRQVLRQIQFQLKWNRYRSLLVENILHGPRISGIKSAKSSSGDEMDGGGSTSIEKLPESLQGISISEHDTPQGPLSFAAMPILLESLCGPQQSHHQHFEENFRESISLAYRILHESTSFLEM